MSAKASVQLTDVDCKVICELPKAIQFHTGQADRACCIAARKAWFLALLQSLAPGNSLTNVSKSHTMQQAKQTVTSPSLSDARQQLKQLAAVMTNNLQRSAANEVAVWRTSDKAVKMLVFCVKPQALAKHYNLLDSCIDSNLDSASAGSWPASSTLLTAQGQKKSTAVVFVWSD